VIVSSRPWCPRRLTPIGVDLAVMRTQTSANPDSDPRITARSSGRPSRSWSYSGHNGQQSGNKSKIAAGVVARANDQAHWAGTNCSDHDRTAMISADGHQHGRCQCRGAAAQADATPAGISTSGPGREGHWHERTPAPAGISTSGHGRERVPAPAGISTSGHGRERVPAPARISASGHGRERVPAPAGISTSGHGRKRAPAPAGGGTDERRHGRAAAQPGIRARGASARAGIRRAGRSASAQKGEFRFRASRRHRPGGHVPGRVRRLGR
jgi:hypothetical protein